MSLYDIYRKLGVNCKTIRRVPCARRYSNSDEETSTIVEEQIGTQLVIEYIVWYLQLNKSNS